MDSINYDHFLESVSPEFRFVIDTFSVVERDQSDSTRPTEFDFRKFQHVLKRHEILLPLSIVMNKLEVKLKREELVHLKELIERHSLTQLRLSGDLLRLLKEFKTQHIDVISLKGPLLSKRLYQSFGNRESVDLDFLIRPEDLQKADRLFKSLGYTPKDYELNRFSLKQRKVFGRVHCNNTYLPGNEYGTEVELHWKVFETENLYHKSTERLIPESQKAQVQGVSVRIMNAEDLLIYLSVHGAKHRWAGLKWLIDIRQFMLLYGKETDWDSLLTTCTDQRIHWPVLQALHLSNGLFRTPLPNKARELIREEPGINNLVKDALYNLKKENFKDNNWAYTLNIIKLRPGWHHTRFYLDRLFYAPQDWNALKLPDFLFFLYFPMRPFLFFYRKLRAR